MAHLTDVFNAAGNVRFGPLSGHPSPLLNVPAPGDSDTGSIVGTIIDIIGGVVGGRGPTLPAFPPVPPGQIPPALPGRSGPGFTLGGAIPSNGTGCLPGAMNPCCRGQHLDKATGTKCVSNRRMNVTNQKALRRAIRRSKGFARVVASNRKALRALARI